MQIKFSQSYFDFEKYILITTLALRVHNRKQGTKTRDLKQKKEYNTFSYLPRM